MTKLPLADCRALLTAIFKAHNVSEENAAPVAAALVAAEADGLTGHGLSRVPAYAAQAMAGKVDGRAQPTSAVSGAVARIDAAHGFAYRAVDMGLSVLPELAKAHGIAMAAITRSHHCGALGHPVETLARRGLVALMVSNTAPAIAAWGGSKPLFGTNPIAFGAQVGDRLAVIDLSLSKVARGNVVRAAQEDRPIPEGWALDADGNATTDAKAALAGTMIPLGDAKGVALALMVEVLAAGVTGANPSINASSFLDTEGGPPGVGQLIIAIDPERGGGSLWNLAAIADAYAAEEGARLPGARRFEARAKAERDGLTVSDTLLAMARA